MEFSEISGKIIECAIKVHRILGPGLLESAYEKCLAYELRKADLNIETQVYLPIIYEGVSIDVDYRLDIIVEDKIILEIKSVRELLPIHQAQLLTYLKLAQKKVGLLMNFNVVLLKQGIKRVVN